MLTIDISDFDVEKVKKCISNNILDMKCYVKLNKHVTKCDKPHKNKLEQLEAKLKHNPFNSDTKEAYNKKLKEYKRRQKAKP